ncbi:unnamed protein product [Cylindrotheca closterium]|uniref:Uncharacterized protein n=1 Tax=Cylindrotheca closterium TaxID=2856 RepID=A0AAD2JI91_9STRA|nr:unnamed protein product [Cylindrotheca closterium]
MNALLTDANRGRTMLEYLLMNSTSRAVPLFKLLLQKVIIEATTQLGMEQRAVELSTRIEPKHWNSNPESRGLTQLFGHGFGNIISSRQGQSDTSFGARAMEEKCQRSSDRSVLFCSKNYQTTKSGSMSSRVASGASNCDTECDWFSSGDGLDGFG